MARTPIVAGDPLSPAQERLWLLDQMGGDGTAYLTARTYWLHGPVDADALERAIRVVAGRHEVLRSRLVASDPAPMAVYDPPESIKLDRIDLTGLPDARQRAIQAAIEHGDRPCDLSTGPLLRAVLVKVSSERFLLHYTVHHSIFDGPSRVIFERALSAAYARLVEGAPANADPLPVRYADFAADQRKLAGTEELQRQLRYWTGRLDGAPAVLDRLADHPRPMEPTGAAGHAAFSVDAEVTDRLRRLAAAERTTVFVVALAAYQYVLATWVGAADLVVGVPFAGRMDPDLEQVIGFFTNTVAIRTVVTGRPSLRDLVRQVRERVLEALDNQDVPFDRVVDALGAARDRRMHPVFQHWFGLVDGELAESMPVLPSVECRLVQPPLRTTRFDTEVDLRLLPHAVDGTMTYAMQLFEPVGIGRLVGQFQRVLAVASADPDAPLASLALTDERERCELLRLAGQGTPVTFSAASLLERLREQYARASLSVAVSDGVTTLTYRELAAAVAGVAGRLDRAGVRRGDVVALHLPRGCCFVVAMLAAVSVGAAYLPLDVQSPPERLAYQLRDCAVSAVLTTVDSVPPAGSWTAMVVDMVGTDASAEWRPQPRVTAADLLYVIYTSGTTGSPKGVAVTHGQFGLLVEWHVRTYPLAVGDRVAQVASVSFDAAGWEIWPALLSGARLDICSDEVVRSPDALVRWLARTGTTAMFAPTPLAEQLLRYRLDRETRLRFLLTGGDAFRPGPTDDPGVDVFNHYGPTENAVVATATAGLRAPWRDNSIGRPIGRVRTYLLDAEQNLAPRGAVGELYLGGPGVAWGYWGRPALTAERFVPDAFSGTPGARLYRTGDLARWRSDDALCYLGRTDMQLSVRGYRIEPAEVESALLANPEIAAAAVVVATVGSGQPVLVGYLVPTHPERGLPDAARLRAFLAPTLPHYLIPQAFVALDALPMTANGKVDRRQLSSRELLTAPPVAARTEVEKVMCRLWRDVLGVDEIGVHDDFFGLGGNSITAARLLTRINQVFRTRFPLRGIFDRRSLAELSLAVEAQVVAEIRAMSPEQLTAELDRS